MPGNTSILPLELKLKETSNESILLGRGGVQCGLKDIILVGMIQQCIKANFLPDVVFAASGGGLVGTVWMCGRPGELENIFLNVRNKDIRKFNPLLCFGKSASIYSYKPFWKYMAEMVDAEECRHGDFDCWVSVSDLKTKDVQRYNMRDLPEDTDPVKVLVSSASIPILVPPVDGRWVDGGVCDDYGLIAALEAGATEIVVLFPGSSADWSNPKNIVDATSGLINMLHYSNYQRQKEALNFILENKYQYGDSGNKTVQINLLRQEAKKIQLTEIEVLRDDFGIWDFDYDPKARPGLIQQGRDAVAAIIH